MVLDEYLIPPMAVSEFTIDPPRDAIECRYGTRCLMRFDFRNAHDSPHRSCSSQDSRYNPLAMAIFKAEEVNDEQRDWIMLRDGGVYLYWRREILADDVDWLKSNGYRIISFDTGEWQSASDWESEKLMHESLKAKLSFPDY